MLARGRHVRAPVDGLGAGATIHGFAGGRVRERGVEGEGARSEEGRRAW
ncbi:Hypothetical protein CAP_3970 [Chondromyces apiculatus DSM 436]|uniref:Uncharacterized protein n=1 Tax=Chondromyces apiculatus DSM 436 TaxID=1192034 RepID=A0A017TII4_9BACT|nr:Hypothetical protein CAP_3970 [Chondromyces apiculatus DSM 436]